MQKLADTLLRLPSRLVAIIVGFVLVALVWAAVKLFPSLDARSVALVGAFALAGLLAFSRSGRWRA